MAIGAILSHADYTRTMDQIRRLQAKLHDLAHRKGNLHPEVIVVSQQIDDYIVSIQRYWQYTRDGRTG